MNKRKPTIVDIANELGISPSAVSKAFSNHPRMSEQTKKEVLRMAKSLGYKRNNMATGLRMGKSGLIGVMVPWINLNFFSTAIKGIEDVLGAAGYSILIGQSKDSEEKEAVQVNAFLNAQVEGIIASIAANTQNHTHFKHAIDAGVKVILFDRTIPGLEVTQVMIDDFDAAYKATLHLIEQGYKRIGLISGPFRLLPYRNRVDGYKAALRENGRMVDEGLILETDVVIDCGKTSAVQMMAHPDPPDAIFCLSDLLALGAMRAIVQIGKRIPDEIGLIGFSNEDFTTYVSPSLSSVDQFSEEMGNTAAKALLEQLEVGKSNDTDQSFIPDKHVLTSKLLIRESSTIIKTSLML